MATHNPPDAASSGPSDALYRNKGNHPRRALATKAGISRPTADLRPGRASVPKDHLWGDHHQPQRAVDLRLQRSTLPWIPRLRMPQNHRESCLMALERGHLGIVKPMKPMGCDRGERRGIMTPGPIRSLSQ
jgi:hypothetical protein